MDEILIIYLFELFLKLSFPASVYEARQEGKGERNHEGV